MKMRPQSGCTVSLHLSCLHLLRCRQQKLTKSRSQTSTRKELRSCFPQHPSGDHVWVVLRSAALLLTPSPPAPAPGWTELVSHSSLCLRCTHPAVAAGQAEVSLEESEARLYGRKRWSEPDTCWGTHGASGVGCPHCGLASRHGWVAGTWVRKAVGEADVGDAGDAWGCGEWRRSGS